MRQLAFVLAVIFLPLPSPAQSVYKVRPVLDGSIIAGTLLGGLLPYLYADKLIHPRCPCDAGEVNGFDRPAIGNHSGFADTLSDITVGAAVLVPVALDALDLGLGSELAEDLVVYVEALAVNGALVSLVKYAAQRPLPRTYEGDPALVAGPGGYRSFYSGHSSMAFAALGAASVTSNLRHHTGAWPWIVTGVIGTSVAVERVAAGRHFPTDVIAGTVAGLATGIVVPLLHARAPDSKETITFVPAAEGFQVLWMRPL